MRFGAKIGLYSHGSSVILHSRVDFVVCVFRRFLFLQVVDMVLKLCCFRLLLLLVLKRGLYTVWALMKGETPFSLGKTWKPEKHQGGKVFTWVMSNVVWYFWELFFFQVTLTIASVYIATLAHSENAHIYCGSSIRTDGCIKANLVEVCTLPEKSFFWCPHEGYIVNQEASTVHTFWL